MTIRSGRWLRVQVDDFRADMAEACPLGVQHPASPALNIQMGWQLTPFLKLRVDVCQEPKAYDMYEIWKEMEKKPRNFKKREGGKQREKQRGTAHVNQQKVDWKNKLKERISRPPLHLSLCNIQTLRRLPLLNARRHALNICPALRLIPNAAK